MSYNRTIIVGNLTRDPEYRVSASGVAVGRLPLACNHRHKKSDGEKTEETLYIDAVVFGKQADVCKQYLAKGKPALVEGRLSEREWEFEGKKGKKIELIASNVVFLSNSSNGQPKSVSSPDGESADAVIS